MTLQQYLAKIEYSKCIPNFPLYGQWVN